MNDFILITNPPCKTTIHKLVISTFKTMEAVPLTHFSETSNYCLLLISQIQPNYRDKQYKAMVIFPLTIIQEAQGGLSFILNHSKNYCIIVGQYENPTTVFMMQHIKPHASFLFFFTFVNPNQVCKLSPLVLKNQN